MIYWIKPTGKEFSQMFNKYSGQGRQHEDMVFHLLKDTSLYANRK
jgi:hypothetical protein